MLIVVMIGRWSDDNGRLSVVVNVMLPLTSVKSPCLDLSVRTKVPLCT